MNNLTIAFAALLALASCTKANDTASQGRADRTVVVQMRDNHFEPDRLDVRRGEMVAFRFVNRGQVSHDAFIGGDEAQTEHEEEARVNEEGHGGEHSATDEDAITVAPGRTGRLDYTFDESGKTLIGCHKPGHYKSGMVMTITVR